MDGPRRVWPRAWPKRCVTTVQSHSRLHCHVGQLPAAHINGPWVVAESGKDRDSQ